MKFAYFTYHQKDNNMLETCIHSLHAVAPDVQIIIVTDGVPDIVKSFLSDNYNVWWQVVDPKQMSGRRATCKIEMLLHCFQKYFADHDKVLVSDVDVYFQADPFKPFNDNRNMDIGVTTRGYEHLFPINGGIFFLRVNPRVRGWIAWHVDEIFENTWEPYIEARTKYKHHHFGLDWSVGQDFLISTWMEREALKKSHGLSIVDAGPRYNYCPPTDRIGAQAFEFVRDVIGDVDTAAVIHLKSKLKTMIYEEDVFPNVMIRHDKGATTWM